jgi:hypothetical protein
MRHGELIAPFLCACVIWCPISWAWWAYWQMELLQYIQKNHTHFDRTFLWSRKRGFWINLCHLYLFDLNKNNLDDERVAYLKSKLRPALIGFLGGQFLATAYTIGIILAVQVFHWL